MRSTFKPQFAKYTWKAAAVSLQFCADEIKAPAARIVKAQKARYTTITSQWSKEFSSINGIGNYLGLTL